MFTVLNTGVKRQQKFDYCVDFYSLNMLQIIGKSLLDKTNIKMTANAQLYLHI